MITAGQAKVLANNSPDDVVTLSEAEIHIEIMARLGFRNTSFRVPLNNKAIKKALVEAGYSVYEAPDFNNMLEIYW